MLYAIIHQEVLYAVANQITQAIHIKDAQISMSASQCGNLVHQQQSVRTQVLATTADVHKDMQPNQIQKSLANRWMWTFCVKATSTVPTTPNVLKVNASARMVLSLKDRFVWISMNAERMLVYVDQIPYVLIPKDRIDASAQRKLMLCLKSELLKF